MFFFHHEKWVLFHTNQIYRSFSFAWVFKYVISSLVWIVSAHLTQPEAVPGFAGLHMDPHVFSTWWYRSPSTLRMWGSPFSKNLYSVNQMHSTHVVPCPCLATVGQQMQSLDRMWVSGCFPDAAVKTMWVHCWNEGSGSFLLSGMGPKICIPAKFLGDASGAAAHSQGAHQVLWSLPALLLSPLLEGQYPSAEFLLMSTERPSTLRCFL